MSYFSDDENQDEEARLLGSEKNHSAEHYHDDSSPNIPRPTSPKKQVTFSTSPPLIPSSKSLDDLIDWGHNKNNNNNNDSFPQHPAPHLKKKKKKIQVPLLKTFQTNLPPPKAVPQIGKLGTPSIILKPAMEDTAKPRIQLGRSTDMTTLRKRLGSTVKVPSSKTKQDSYSSFQEFQAVIQELPAQWKGRVAGYCVAEAYDLEKVYQFLKRNYPQQPKRYEGAISFNWNLNSNELHKLKDIFIFEFGAIVFWGMVEHHEMEIIQKLQEFEIGSYPPDEIGKEKLSYSYDLEQLRRDHMSQSDHFTQTEGYESQDRTEEPTLISPPNEDQIDFSSDHKYSTDENRQDDRSATEILSPKKPQDQELYNLEAQHESSGSDFVSPYPSRPPRDDVDSNPSAPTSPLNSSHTSPHLGTNETEENNSQTPNQKAEEEQPSDEDEPRGITTQPFNVSQTLDPPESLPPKGDRNTFLQSYDDEKGEDFSGLPRIPRSLSENYILQSADEEKIPSSGLDKSGHLKVVHSPAFETDHSTDYESSTSHMRNTFQPFPDTIKKEFVESDPEGESNIKLYHSSNEFERNTFHVLDKDRGNLSDFTSNTFKKNLIEGLRKSVKKPVRSQSGRFHKPKSKPKRPVDPSSQIYFLFNEIVLKHWQTDFKLAIAFSIGQCTKMDVVETQAGRLQEKTRFLAEELCETGRIGSLSTPQISTLMGDLWVWKNKTLLQSNIMDEPDFFWECEHRLLKAYRLTQKYFEMEVRLEILEQREENLMEFLDLLKDESDHRFSWRRNALITLLVLLELVMQIVKTLVGTPV